MKRHILLLAMAGLAWPTACHCEKPLVAPDAGPDALADRPILDSMPDSSDSGPDAWQPPEGAPPHAQMDFCDLPRFYVDLPDGKVPGTVFLGGGWFNDGWYEPHITSCSLFLYDLTHCIRYQLSPDWWKITDYDGLDLAHNAVVITAANAPQSEWNVQDIYYISLDDWQIVQLTNTPDADEFTPVFNGRYVVYNKADRTADISYGKGLWLLDTDTMEATMLDEPGMASTDYQINDRYVVWKSWGNKPDSYGRDIFFYDLQTRQKGHVPASAQGWAYQVDVGSHWIAWRDSARENSPPYRIWIYDIHTGDATMLSEEPDFFGFNLDHELLVWETYAYCGDECYHNVTNLEAYDVRTGLRRRLTTRQYPWGSGPGHMNLPWLLVGATYDAPYPQGIFLLNLEKLEVVDQDGHLLPGDPTIEPPPDP